MRKILFALLFVLCGIQTELYSFTIAPGINVDPLSNGNEVTVGFTYTGTAIFYNDPVEADR